MGAWSAEIADDAVGPEVMEFTVCGLAVDIPVAGSAFPAGHLDGLFLAPGKTRWSVFGRMLASLYCGTEPTIMVPVEEFEEFE